MHELSLCQSIQGIVDRARDGRPVATVHLRVGRLRQVVPETLSYCWGLVTEAGPLAGSVLDVDHVPVVLDCRDCGERTTVADALLLTCGACGSGAIRVASGEELLVTSIDLAPRGPTAPATTPTTHTAEED
ncbi:hydrogenase maturation nickel metallochaperone HypA [Nocardioides sp. YIM 152588]|uniref:hydrogenase maturation nickel metallochaperone HypA n=1 Tax=Nocardioides sp. YIM 152588 TaxID=3158259 RepID=UPI0032E49B6F